MTDMGVFYLGRNPSEQGIVFRDNFVHDCANAYPPTYVFHLDDGACGVELQGNVLARCDCACNVNGGLPKRLEDNLLVDLATAEPRGVRRPPGRRPARWAPLPAGPGDPR